MARVAARRSGLPLHEWLNCAIIEAAANKDVRLPARVFNKHGQELAAEEAIVVVTQDRVESMTDEAKHPTLYRLNAAITQEPAAQRDDKTIDLDHILSVLHRAIETLQGAETRITRLTEVLQGLVDLSDSSRTRDLGEVQRLLARARKLLSVPTQSTLPHDPTGPCEAAVPAPVLAA